VIGGHGSGVDGVAVMVIRRGFGNLFGEKFPPFFLLKSAKWAWWIVTW
jgi:1-acyl-sn-glycerol-3-phosphate acyltransferase